MLPPMAFAGFGSRHELPEMAEGFQDVIRLDFEARAIFSGFGLGNNTDPRTVQGLRRAKSHMVSLLALSAFADFFSKSGSEQTRNPCLGCDFYAEETNRSTDTDKTILVDKQRARKPCVMTHSKEL